MGGMTDESQELRAFAPALALLAIFALINFIDRGNLSIAAPLLQEELRISASQLGILLSAFFWTYTTKQFVSGWIVDSFDVNRVIAAGFLLWSLATAATGLVRGFAMLLACPALIHDPLDNAVSFAIQSIQGGACHASVKAFPLTDRCRRRMADGITCNGISRSCRATCAPASSVRACAHRLDHR